MCCLLPPGKTDSPAIAVQVEKIESSGKKQQKKEQAAASLIAASAMAGTEFHSVRQRHIVRPGVPKVSRRPAIKQSELPMVAAQSPDGPPTLTDSLCLSVLHFSFFLHPAHLHHFVFICSRPLLRLARPMIKI